METRAPAVVAVVVTTGPAPHLSETLASLGSQDYDQCSVLVLVNGESEGLAEQVSATLPSAFVRVLDENRGYPAACNEVIGMVEGAAFLCFCHDDVVLAPDAIHLMVQEAFRSNAGIVAPMIVRPEDHAVLLHLGLNADRFGATTERVEPGDRTVNVVGALDAIVETRPLSKLKRWRMTQIVERAAEAPVAV